MRNGREVKKQIKETEMDVYNETEFDHVAGDDTACISTGERAVKNRLAKLSEKYPSECVCVAQNRDGSVYYRIPWRWLSIRPPKQMNLTDAQKAERAERLRQARTL